MDDWEHFCSCQYSIYFEITRIEVLALINRLLVIVSFGYFDIEGLVEAVDFIFHGPAESLNFGFGEPVAMHIAFSLVFGQVFYLIGALANSSP